MRIPKNTKKDRYCVATSLKAAFSSWNTLEEARACIQRFKVPILHADLSKIVCIVRTNLQGKEIFKEE